MTRFIHDQFAKDYLGGLLELYGEVTSPLELASEVRQIDIWFVPSNSTGVDRANLGLLGRLTQNSCLLEPFSSAVKTDEICNCLLKLLLVRNNVQRAADRNKQPISKGELPQLWILTPTASKAVLEGVKAEQDLTHWLPGVYLMGKDLGTGIVVIHQLPRQPETLWLRLLGKGKVRERAIAELEALPEDNPLQNRALESLRSLKAILEARRDLSQNEDDRRLIVRLSPIYLSQLAEAKQEGIQEGMQQGIQEGMQQGIQEGMQEGILSGIEIALALQLKFGNPGLELLPAISQLADVGRLQAIQQALLTVTTISELRQLIEESTSPE